MTPPPELLTRMDLAVLAGLTETPAATDTLVPGTLFVSYWPTRRALASKLGHLHSRGLVAKTDTGGPVKQRRTLWAITPDGQAVVDNYRKAHFG